MAQSLVDVPELYRLLRFGIEFDENDDPVLFADIAIFTGERKQIKVVYPAPLTPTRLERQTLKRMILRNLAAFESAYDLQRIAQVGTITTSRAGGFISGAAG